MNEEIFENELSDMNLEMMKKKFKSSLWRFYKEDKTRNWYFQTQDEIS